METKRTRHPRVRIRFRSRLGLRLRIGFGFGFRFGFRSNCQPKHSNVSSVQNDNPERTIVEPPEIIDEEPETIDDESCEEPETRTEVEAAASSESKIEVQVIPTTTKVNKMLDIPTITKTLEQMKCKGCLRMMSTTTLKHEHANYCPERVLEKRPVDIPVPQLRLENENIKAEQTRTSQKFED